MREAWHVSGGVGDGTIPMAGDSSRLRPAHLIGGPRWIELCSAPDDRGARGENAGGQWLRTQPAPADERFPGAVAGHRIHPATGMCGSAATEPNRAITAVDLELLSAQGIEFESAHHHVAPGHGGIDSTSRGLPRFERQKGHRCFGMSTDAEETVAAYSLVGQNLYGIRCLGDNVGRRSVFRSTEVRVGGRDEKRHHIEAVFVEHVHHGGTPRRVGRARPCPECNGVCANRGLSEPAQTSAHLAVDGQQVGVGLARSARVAPLVDSALQGQLRDLEDHPDVGAPPGRRVVVDQGEQVK